MTTPQNPYQRPVDPELSNQRPPAHPAFGPATGQMPISPPPGYGWAPPPKKSFWKSTGGILTIVFGTIGLIVAGCVGLAVLGFVTDQNAAKDMDVKITSCRFEGSGALPSVTVGLQVTNTGSSARGASVGLEYRDGGGRRIDTDTARVPRLAPGDTAAYEEVTFLDAPTSGGTCKITKVS